MTGRRVVFDWFPGRWRRGIYVQCLVGWTKKGSDQICRGACGILMNRKHTQKHVPISISQPYACISYHYFSNNTYLYAVWCMYYYRYAMALKIVGCRDVSYKVSGGSVSGDRKGDLKCGCIIYYSKVTTHSDIFFFLISNDRVVNIFFKNILDTPGNMMIVNQRQWMIVVCIRVWYASALQLNRERTARKWSYPIVMYTHRSPKIVHFSAYCVFPLIYVKHS